MDLYKTCVLCPAKISRKYKLCHVCYKKHKQDIGTPWFNELEVLQAQQDLIDYVEGHNIPYSASTQSNGKQHVTGSTKKDVGRPSTHWSIVNEVLEIYDRNVRDISAGAKKLSLRRISSLVEHKVSFLTVRNIIKKYRS